MYYEINSGLNVCLEILWNHIKGCRPDIMSKLSYNYYKNGIGKLTFILRQYNADILKIILKFKRVLISSRTIIVNT